MRKIYFFLIPLIFIAIACKNDNIKKQYPSLCLIESADIFDLWPSADIALTGLEINPKSYFFIRGLNMAGSRIFLVTKCNNQTFKQYVFIPNEQGTIGHMAITGKSQVRFFTSKEIADVEVWENLSNEFTQFVNDPAPEYGHPFGPEKYIIKYNLYGKEKVEIYYDSIPVNYINFLDNITGFDRNGIRCDEICEKYFRIDY